MLPIRLLVFSYGANYFSMIYINIGYVIYQYFAIFTDQAPVTKEKDAKESKKTWKVQMKKQWKKNRKSKRKSQRLLRKRPRKNKSR